ncbi:hypothetical protein KA183_05040 [bacterium]|nr:hypothetical protein [bacterium]QQR56209.1 MAG: hypothetical protein IPG59_14480 [Candidatus Melainabacteria bacterium]
MSCTKWLAGILLSSILASSISVGRVSADEWIEDESQINQQNQQAPQNPVPQNQAPSQFPQPQTLQQSLDEQMPNERERDLERQQRYERQERVEEKPVGNTTDFTRPLEAGVSSFKQIDNDFTNLPLLLQKPVSALPKTGPVTRKTFQNWLAQSHPGLAARISKDQVIEIKGEWDDSAHALSSFGIPFTRIGPKQIRNYDLTKTKVIVLSCPGALLPDESRALANYVKSGGYLITTDWALEILNEMKGFVRIIEPSGFELQEQVVDAVGLSADPLCKNVPSEAFWKIAKESKAVRIVQRNYCTVVARSKMLMNMEIGHIAKYRPPEEADLYQAGILAVLVDYGRGKIFHLVGHYDNDANTAFVNDVPDQAPGISISMRQAMATNFIAEAFEK